MQKLISVIFFLLIALTNQVAQAKVVLVNTNKKLALMIQIPKSKKELEEDTSLRPKFYTVNCLLPPQHYITFDLSLVHELGVYIEIKSPYGTYGKHFNLGKERLQNDTAYNITTEIKCKVIEGLKRLAVSLHLKRGLRIDYSEDIITITRYFPPIELSEPKTDESKDLVKQSAESSSK